MSCRRSTDVNFESLLESNEFFAYFKQYSAFKKSIRCGDLRKRAQLWLNYIDFIDLVLTLIKATKENDLDLHDAALYALCPMFFAFDHNNYARYIPAYLVSFLNLSETHLGASELLQSNGFSVSRSTVPKC